MKNFYLAVILFITISASAFAQQNNQDVVYLKNGNVIRGTITELVVNDFLKIVTNDGLSQIYKMNEVEKIQKEASIKQRNYTSGKKFYVGGSMGANMSLWSNAGAFAKDLSTTYASNGLMFDLKNHPLFGVNFGLSFGYRPTNWLITEIEVNYLMSKGQSFSDNGYVYSNGTKTYMFLRENLFVDYIQVPIIAKFITKSGVYLSLGPDVEFFTQEAVKVHLESDGSKPAEQREVVKGRVKPVNFGMLVGGGYQKNHFGIELRYLYDFLDTYKPEYNNYQFKNHMVQLSMYFYLGKGV